MSSDVKSKKVTATGSVLAHAARIKAISFKPAAAGSIVLKDGGASGTTLLDLDVDTGSTTHICFPGDGIKFNTDVHATLGVVSSLTVFYG